MSFAFEVTQEDVINVMEHRLSKTCSFERAERILGALDISAIEQAALRGDDLDDQTSAAYDEIERQLRDANLMAD